MSDVPPLRYDDIYEISRDTDLDTELILWLRERGLWGDSGGLCLFCLEGTFSLKKDKPKIDGIIYC